MANEPIEAWVAVARGGTAADRQLEADLLSLRKRGLDSQARFMAGRVSAEYIQLMRFELLEKTLGNHDRIRQCLTELKVEIERGLDWTRPSEVRIPRAGKPPVIDGKIEAKEWENALTFTGEHPLNSRDHRKTKAVWKIMYDESCLYVSGQFDDSDLRSQQDRPYLKDALELFVMPDPALHVYREYGTGTGNHPWTAWCVNRLYGQYDTYPEPSGLHSMTSWKGTLNNGRDRDEGYSVEMAIPFKELPGYRLGNTPQPGQPISFMLIRTCDDWGVYSRSTPVPFLYDGHNIFGYIPAILN